MRDLFETDGQYFLLDEGGCSERRSAAGGSRGSRVQSAAEAQLVENADGGHDEEAASGGQRARTPTHEQPQRRLREAARSRAGVGQRSQALQVRDAADGADVHWRLARALEAVLNRRMRHQAPLTTTWHLKNCPNPVDSMVVATFSVEKVYLLFRCTFHLVRRSLLSRRNLFEN